MKRKALVIVAISLISTSAFAWSGAEVVLGGMIGYLVGEKVGEDRDRVYPIQAVPMYQVTPVLPPIQRQGKQAPIQPIIPVPTYEQVLFFDQFCSCYRTVWIQR